MEHAFGEELCTESAGRDSRRGSRRAGGALAETVAQTLDAILPADSLEEERQPQRRAGRTRTDVGLALVQRSVEFQGGWIEVASQPGFGTTFTMRLPLPGDVMPGTATSGYAMIPRAAESMTTPSTLKKMPAEVLQFAATAAALNCTREGADPPTREEVRVAIAAQG